MREHLFKRCNLLLGVVSSIINKNIDARDGLSHSFPKLPVALITDQYLNPVRPIGLASLLYVDTVHLATFAEVLSPHREAAPAINPDLHHMDIAANKSCKVAMIDIKVMSPLPNARPLGEIIEIVP